MQNGVQSVACSNRLRSPLMLGVFLRGEEAQCWGSSVRCDSATSTWRRFRQGARTTTLGTGEAPGSRSAAIRRHFRLAARRRRSARRARGRLTPSTGLARPGAGGTRAPIDLHLLGTEWDSIMHHAHQPADEDDQLPTRMTSLDRGRIAEFLDEQACVRAREQQAPAPALGDGFVAGSSACAPPRRRSASPHRAHAGYAT